MQRKTITISRELFQGLKEFNQNTRQRLLYYVLDSLFDGKTATNEEIPEDIRDAYIGFKYEFNKIQKQFENGKKSVQKKSTQIFTQSLCPLEDTQLDPIQPNLTQVEPRTHTHAIGNKLYNKININNNNNNKINNIYNINNIDNKQTNKIINNKYISKDLCDFTLTQENRDVTEWWLDILHEKITKIAELEPVLASRFSELVNRVAEQVRPIKLQGYYTAPEVVLEKYLNFFCCESAEAIKRLSQIYEGFEIKTTTTNINNTFKYLVAYFYNKACEI